MDVCFVSKEICKALFQEWHVLLVPGFSSFIIFGFCCSSNKHNNLENSSQGEVWLQLNAKKATFMAFNQDGSTITAQCPLQKNRRRSEKDISILK